VAREDRVDDELVLVEEPEPLEHPSSVTLSAKVRRPTSAADDVTTVPR